MNVREQDRRKSSCSSRGIGLGAAAAISVGVGAALYYFFNKRPENPHSEGATSDWTCERPDTFFPLIDDESDSYTTLSEHETTDTSMNSSYNTTSENSYDTESQTSDNENTQSDPDFDSSDGTDMSTSDVSEAGFMSSGLTSDSDMTEWDVTSSSADIPMAEVPSSVRTLVSTIENLISPRRRVRTTDEEQLAILRQQAFRERSWTLEECSICFDVMLRGQDVMSLPCAHNFHTQCLLPWLQEKQTCPNCRKAAE